MKELHTEIDINAPAERVWQVLVDFAAYPRWNPFIRRIGGIPMAGERLEVRLQPSGARGFTFHPEVLAAEPTRELRWLGHLLAPKVFDGEHIFTIEPLAEERVRFVQREIFSGLLVPFFMRFAEADTRRGFEEMNRALKEHAEASISEP
ncbi:MAG: SRPBCC domain-containing protein [Actinomycetota bacterium]|nr:SRPBCC domain-containing protein [Actinomycetota bacterium]